VVFKRWERRVRWDSNLRHLYVHHSRKQHCGNVRNRRYEVAEDIPVPFLRGPVCWGLACGRNVYISKRRGYESRLDSAIALTPRNQNWRTWRRFSVRYEFPRVLVFTCPRFLFGSRTLDWHTLGAGAAVVRNFDGSRRQACLSGFEYYIDHTRLPLGHDQGWRARRRAGLSE
jgi:hypothetical protein